jgi:hypothetical protein
MTNTEDIPPGMRRAPAGGTWFAAMMIISLTRMGGEPTVMVEGQ